MKNIILTNKFEEDEFTKYIIKSYDLQINNETITEIPIFDKEELKTFNWNIGLIIGNSGCGKSTILKTFGEIKNPQYDNNKPICSQFPNLSEQEVCKLLNSVGLSSIMIWFNKPQQLSNGERARLDLAYYIANSKENEIILIDEFTSVVNRDCAKSLSYNLQKYIRKNNLKIILASCHYDLIEWLKPDWVFNLNKGTNEIEQLNYLEDYKIYNNIEEKNILTNEKDISQYFKEFATEY